MVVLVKVLLFAWQHATIYVHGATVLVWVIKNVNKNRYIPIFMGAWYLIPISIF